MALSGRHRGMNMAWSPRYAEGRGRASEQLQLPLSRKKFPPRKGMSRRSNLVLSQLRTKNRHLTPFHLFNKLQELEGGSVDPRDMVQMLSPWTLGCRMSSSRRVNRAAAGRSEDGRELVISTTAA